MTVSELIKELKKQPAETEVRVEGAAMGSRNIFHDTIRDIYLKTPYKTYSQYVVIQGGPFGSIEKLT